MGPMGTELRQCANLLKPVLQVRGMLFFLLLLQSGVWSVSLPAEAALAISECGVETLC